MTEVLFTEISSAHGLTIYPSNRATPISIYRLPLDHPERLKFISSPKRPAIMGGDKPSENDPDIIIKPDGHSLF